MVVEAHGPQRESLMALLVCSAHILAVTIANTGSVDVDDAEAESSSTEATTKELQTQPPLPHPQLRAVSMPFNNRFRSAARPSPAASQSCSVARNGALAQTLIRRPELTIGATGAVSAAFQLRRLPLHEKKSLLNTLLNRPLSGLWTLLNGLLKGQKRGPGRLLKKLALV